MRFFASLRMTRGVDGDTSGDPPGRPYKRICVNQRNQRIEPFPFFPRAPRVPRGENSSSFSFIRVIRVPTFPPSLSFLSFLICFFICVYLRSSLAQIICLYLDSCSNVSVSVDNGRHMNYLLIFGVLGAGKTQEKASFVYVWGSFGYFGGSLAFVGLIMGLGEL